MRPGIIVFLFALPSLTEPALAQSLGDIAAIKPSRDELKWLRSPWLLDPAEGERAAKRENRLLFLWATGDDPLERC